MRAAGRRNRIGTSRHWIVAPQHTLREFQPTIARMMHRCLIAISMFVAAVAAASGAERQPRYAAMLVNGQRIQGDKLHDWHDKSAQPRLDGQPLLEPSNPVRWLRDRSLRLAELPAAYVELHGGDRFPGQVIAYRTGQEEPFRAEPPHFVVRAAIKFEPPENKPVSDIRITASSVRRIVWQRRGRLPYQPGTAFYRDGRQVSFRAVRITGEQVHLLLTDGDRRIPWGDLAEIHFPQPDQWNAMYDDLAILCPTLDTRLIQFETTGGLIATTSLARFVPRFEGNSADADRWVHAIQPAWSLDLLWIPCREIAYRRTWLPREVPLTRVAEAAVKSLALAGLSRKVEVNRNELGGPLRNKSQEFGWGMGVHSRSELVFDLPAGVRSIRTQVCLDRDAGKGGCIRARLFANETKGAPLWESPILVGSETVADTGNLPLAGLASGQKQLVLQIDAVEQNRPAGADPLDIRDHANWCEPLLELDPAVVQAELDKRLRHRFAAWKDWTPRFIGTKDSTEAGLELTIHRNERLPPPGAFHTAIQVKAKPLAMSRTITIGPQDKWLLIAATRPLSRGQEPKLEVRIGGEPVAELVVPQRHDDVDENRPLAISLASYRKDPPQSIEVEIRQLAAADSAPVEYRLIQTAAQLPTLHQLFEDADSAVLARPATAAKTQLIDDERHYGSHALKVTAGGKSRLEFPFAIPIRERPGWGENRFIRFAIRKKGGGRLSLGLETPGPRTTQPVYDAGKGEPVFAGATRVWGEALPEQWIVITRDLFADFGAIDLTAIELGCPDGEFALFDHIYLARAPQDLDRIAAAPSPQLTNAKARQDLARPIIERAQPATVRIEFADGRQAAGVIISDQGEILTAGHAVIGPNRDARVTLHDGTTRPAKTLGVAREFDIGLLKIDAPGTYPRLDPHAPAELPHNQLYIAMLLKRSAAEFERSEGEVVDLRRVFRSTVWTDLEPPDWLAGGPLIDRDSRVVGIQTRVSRFGGVMCTRFQDAWQHIPRLRNSEVFGPSQAGAEPLLGFTGLPVAEGYKLSDVAAGGPAAKAALQAGDIVVRIDGKPIVGDEDLQAALSEKDAGQEVLVDYTRGGAAMQAKLTLAPREP